MLTIIFHDMSEGVLSVSRFFSVFFFHFVKSKVCPFPYKIS